MSVALRPQMVYVVRLWSSETVGSSIWRVSIENPISAERHVFADLEEFFTFLEDQTGAIILPEAQQPIPNVKT